MTQKQQKSQTKQLVADYTAWRLAKAGYHHWHQLNKVNVKENTQSQLCTAMRHLAYKFEKVHQARFDDDLEVTAFNCRDTLTRLIGQLFDLSNISMNECEFMQDKAMFNCHWGLVIALVSFSGCLAIQCYDNQQSNLIYSIIDLQIEYLVNDKRISGWIEEQGGWNSFLEYFDARYNLLKLEDIELPIENLNNAITRSNYFYKFHTTSSNNSKIENMFNLESLQHQCKQLFCKLSKYAGVTVGSIGVLVLGAIYMKKK